MHSYGIVWCWCVLLFVLMCFVRCCAVLCGVVCCCALMLLVVLCCGLLCVCVVVACWCIFLYVVVCFVLLFGFEWRFCVVTRCAPSVVALACHVTIWLAFLLFVVLRSCDGLDFVVTSCALLCVVARCLLSCVVV